MPDAGLFGGSSGLSSITSTPHIFIAYAGSLGKLMRIIGGFWGGGWLKIPVER